MRRSALAAALLWLALGAAVDGGAEQALARSQDGPAARIAAGTALATGDDAASTARAATAGRALAAAPGCVPRRHGKPVVRHPRRHGRVRTVRRVRHWWSCDQAPSPAGDEASPPTPGPPAEAATPAPVAPVPLPEPEPELEPGPTRLSVKSLEYSYTLSRLTLTAGEDTIELDNRGQDAHNLNLELVGSEEAPLEIPETESLQRRTAHFTLQPGTYRLWCSLPTHDEEGMHATLVVEAP